MKRIIKVNHYKTKMVYRGTDYLKYCIIDDLTGEAIIMLSSKKSQFVNDVFDYLQNVYYSTHEIYNECGTYYQARRLTNKQIENLPETHPEYFI